MKNIISEMKNTLEEINRRLDEAEDEISDLEDKVAENTQSKQQKQKIIVIYKEREKFMGLLGQHQFYNICIIGAPEGQKESKRLRTNLKK